MGEVSNYLLILLCIIIALLCCMSSYLYRIVGVRHKEQQDMTTAVKSAVEIVLTLTEKGVPGINMKMNEVESRVKVMEQNVKKQESKIIEIAEAEMTTEEAITEIQNAVAGISTERGPIHLSTRPVRVISSAVRGSAGAGGISEEDRIKEARAAKQRTLA